jgi:hypothetical protein
MAKMIGKIQRYQYHRSPLKGASVGAALYARSQIGL